MGGSRKQSGKLLGESERIVELVKKLEGEMMAHLTALNDKEPSHVMTDNKFNIYRQTFAVMCDSSLVFG